VSRLLEIDDPWRRLPWSLPLALLIGAALLWELGRILERPPLHRTAPLSIDAELIELPPPPVPAVARPPEPERPRPAPRRRAVAPKKAPVTLPVARAAPATGRAEPVPPAPPPAPAAPAAPQAPVAKSAGTSNLGAQAIVRPLPEIPDDLREEAFHAVAVVRFHVAADGAATFELIKPTPNPRLNRLLIEKLGEWRFFPAMRDGKPVASDQDIRVTLEVR